jgi:hypothetical protein
MRRSLIDTAKETTMNRREFLETTMTGIAGVDFNG